MTALPNLLTGRGAHANVRNILEAIELKHFGERPSGAPHSIYEEVWHVVYWQRLLLAWCDDSARPAPASAAEGWPTQQAPENLEESRSLVREFLEGVNRATALASDPERLEQQVLGGKYTVRSLLESLLAHNAYHMGRIVLLRQLLGIWPPPSGGDTW